MKTINKELENKFTKKKQQNNPIIESYKRLGMDKKAESLTFCATYLEFKAPKNDEPGKLKKANFCKDRLCNICAWRRSLKIFGQVSKVMDEIENDYEFIFVTLTVRNCSADELPASIDLLQKGFRTMFQNKKIKGFKGYFKALEITNSRKQLRSLEYHPHIHAIVAVNKSYFNSRDYISHDKLVKLWREACELDYDPSVYIEKVKPKPDEKGEISIKKAICETAKYTIKPGKIGSGTYNEIDRTVMAYTAALYHRRLCGFGGILKEVAKKLNLDDMTDGNLVNTDNEEIRTDVGDLIIKYRWKIGVGYEEDGTYIVERIEKNEDIERAGSGIHGELCKDQT